MVNGYIPEVDQKRRLKYKVGEKVVWVEGNDQGDGKLLRYPEANPIPVKQPIYEEILIRIQYVQPAPDAGPKAYWVVDTKGRFWLFSIPSPPTPTTVTT